MRRPTGFKRLLRLAVRPRAVEQDVDEELQFHLEMRAARLEREGLSAGEARAEARRQFGDVASVRAECVRIGHRKERQMRRSHLVEALVQDVRYALRTLGRSPGFALVAVLTLGLGIGATTSLFSVAWGVLFSPLPLASPGQLVRVWQANPGRSVARGAASPLDVEDWRARQSSFTGLGAWFYADEMTGVDLGGEAEPERLAATYVDAGFFSTLGVSPQLGRTLLPEEHQPGRDAIVVSHGFWQRRLGGSPDAIGRTLTLNGRPHTVVGVMPRSFTFPSRRVDVWLSTVEMGEEGISRRRGMRWQSVVARLRPGVTPEVAQTELSGIAAQLAEEHPDSNAQFGAVTVLPLQDSLTTGDVKVALRVLLGAVAFLLLIACANVANLLLARATLRERELAVRAAMGARPARLVGQLLTESLVLAVMGGVLGGMLAVWGTRVLAGLSLDPLPRLDEVRVDGAVLAFAVGTTLVTGLLFGVLPALRGGRPQLTPVLKAAGYGVAGAGGGRLRGALVVAEVALAVVLAAGAGLAARSLAWLHSVDPGFHPQGAAVLGLSVPAAHHHELGPYLGRLLEQVRAAPGVRSAALASVLPLEGAGERGPITLAGPPTGNAGDALRAHMLPVSTDYFRTLGIPLKQGRAFEASDTSGAPQVLVANESFVRRFFPGEQVVGKAAVSMWGGPPATIVGVVGDVRQAGLSEPAPPMLYLHVLQEPRVRVSLVVRGHGQPLQLAATVRKALSAVDPNQTLTRLTTLEEVVGEAVARPLLLATLLGLFAVLGLVLGAVGIYGVLAYTVSQRQRELGVRLALGARRGDVLRLVLRSGMALAGVGVALGVAGALGLSQVMQSLLHGVTPYDPVTFGAVVSLLLGVALVACLVPAWRATRVDPAVTLRAE